MQLLTPKIKIWKKCKKHLERLSFYTSHHKSRSYDVWFLRYKLQRTKIYAILPFLQFLSFYPLILLTNQKIKILKKWKKTWRYYFTLVYHKWRSCDVWLLIYQVEQTEFFVILGSCLPFYAPLTTQKIKFLKKWK